MPRKIGIIGLGYAGLHTALAFGKVQPVVGYDVDLARVEELKNFIDRHGDFSRETIGKSQVHFTCVIDDLKECDLYVVIVPTPLKEGYIPDFSYLISASTLVASLLKPGDIVSYESTVYPGATEEICLPILEEKSDLKFGKDFKLGYSPERINPGDKIHTFSNTPKIVSGSDDEALEILTKEYAKITDQVYSVSNIKTAEAVKIIENIQRDVNIALINELAQVFHLFGIDTQEVINAAKTKWNFVPYQPGLVGGHCISVDPYYLIYKANSLDYSTKLMSTARLVNESTPQYISSFIIKYLVRHNLIKEPTRVAILGITYKENYDDIRNSKVVNLVKELRIYGIDVLIVDPIANKEAVLDEYDIKLVTFESLPIVSAIVLAVGHDQFKALTPNQYVEKLLPKGLIVDIKNIIDLKKFEADNIYIWRL